MARAGIGHPAGPRLLALVGVDAFAGRPWARPLLTARNRGELQRLRRRVRGVTGVISDEADILRTVLACR